MIFESINYSFLLQDFLYATAVGFAVGGVNQIVSVFLYKGKVRLFIKDIFMCTLFAVAVFSYVVSFANYPVVRFYHVFAAFAGFLSFNIRFSTIFHKFSEKIFNFLKPKMLCYIEKVKSTISIRRQKIRKKRVEEENGKKEADLKNQQVLVYNL